MLEKVIESLAAAGPIAMVLGYLAYKLWERLNAVTAQQETRDQEHHTKLMSVITDYQTKFDALHREHQDKVDKLQAQMLRLAVRVQRAVETLAGLEPPQIEKEFEGDDA